ncbi:tubulin-domain-containing protein [Clavulina sp. PMI_390]|nr:tubulin-domain-containing protein [Clavulina sp. PMI_390]
MVREIVNIQIGESFWKTILAEHGIDNDGHYVGSDPLQTERAGVYFTEVNSGSQIKYIPRSLRSGPLGRLYRPDTFIHGESGAGNNWAKGYYTEGAELVESILEVLRQQVEQCESFQGFQIIHSLGGGTGSGLGTLLAAKVREEVPDGMISTFSVLPSPKMSDTVVEPYNAMLSMHQLTENSDLTVCIDNDALYDLSARQGHKAPEFSHLNNTIAMVMAGVSTSLRFPGQLNSDLRKLAMNLVPFPRLHYLAPSYAPLDDIKNRNYSALTTAELTASIFDRKNMLCAINPSMGKYLTAATIYRGKIASRDAEAAVHDIQRKQSSLFVEYIPDNVSTTLCSVAPVGQTKAATCLGNTTAIAEIFQRTQTSYAAMFKRRAYLYWYSQEGMDEMEFTEAESNVLDLMAEYQQYQEAGIEDEEEMGEEGVEAAPSEY